MTCRRFLIKDGALAEVRGGTNKYLRVSVRLNHVLLSNTSSIYIQVKQEDIETGSDGDSEAEEYRIGTGTSMEPIMGLWLLFRISAGGHKLSLSLDKFWNDCSSAGEFASQRNLLRTFNLVDSIGLYLPRVFQAVLNTTCIEASNISFK